MPFAEPSTTREIIRLPTLVVNQIAAGEVVERPASVVKELVENAIDAGATRIAVDLEQGGIELVRVTDDGAGVPLEQAPLMLAPHATSKVREIGDLDAIATMGFRGEAVASILSVSRMSVRSRTRDAEGGWSIEASGDEVGEPAPCAAPVGTSVAVRTLFFNTPARRKFLRTVGTEQTRCAEVVRDAALAHAHIGFTLTVRTERGDERTLFEYPPGQSPRERAIEVLGREYESQLLEIHADTFDDARGVALWGLIGLPSIARSTARAQHVFVNGRPVRDRTIQHAIGEAYRGLIEPGKYPTAAILLEMSPAGVDVNVHPTKTEVRFRDSSAVHQTVYRACRDALRARDLTPVWEWKKRESEGPAQPFLPARADEEPSPTPPTGGRGSDGEADTTSLPRSGRGEGQGPSPARVEAKPSVLPRPADRVLQVHNSYLVTQDEEGLLIIDQHALHERVMFEKLLARLGEKGSLESQRLLTPTVVEVGAHQMGKLEELQETLTRLGVEAHPIGRASVAVHAFPSFLFDRGVEPGEFLLELFDKADARGLAAGKEEALHEVLDMMACKAAIKAGDRMSEGELTELLALRERVERSSNCPHGRPTTIRLPIRELEKRFGRG
ncbi:MAG: DNA mismatch repair endonuclease MutL [Phycisphaerales bacterium]